MVPHSFWLGVQNYTPRGDNKVKTSRSGAVSSISVENRNSPQERRADPPFLKTVRSHDILYKVSRGILYTPARATRAGVARAMAWKTMDVHEQRVRFVVAVMQKAQPFSALRAEYEISPPTGYLWLQRYRKLGVHGIAEQSRKPLRSPRRTDAALERQVVQVWLRYPDWGARKLQVVLAREGVELPRNNHSSHSAASRSGARGGTAHPGRATLRAQPAQRAVADGLQRAEGMAATAGTSVGTGRPQSLPDCSGSQR